MGETGRSRRRALVAVMRTQGIGVDQIAAEIRCAHACGPLTAYRLVHDWSQTEAAKAYNQAVGAHQGLGLQTDPGAGMSRQRLARIECWPHGGAEPRLTELTVLAGLYSTVPACLIDPLHLPLLESACRAALLLNSTTIAGRQVGTAHAETVKTEMVKTTRFAAEEATGSVEMRTGAEDRDVVLRAADAASLFYAERESTAVGSQTVADFHDDLARIARAYVHHPLPELAGELAGLQHRAFALLRTPRRVRDTRGLLVIAGLACGLLAHASMDLGNRTAAARQAQVAWLLAEEADHHPLMAWTAGTRSLVAYCLGDQASALRHAAGAQHLSGTGTAAIRLACLTARAHARRGNAGDADNARQLLTHAARTRDTLRTTSDLDQMGGVLTFPTSKQHYYTGSTHVWMAAAAPAEKSTTAAITAYLTGPAEQLSYGDLALSRIYQAHARLLGPGAHLDAAQAALADVLATPVDRRIAGLQPPLLQIRERLHAPQWARHPTARDLTEQITVFLSHGPTPVPNAAPGVGPTVGAP